MDDIDEGFLKKVGKLYKRKCKKCHGTEGDGKGSAADDMEIEPTAFTAPGYLKSRVDGQLYWILEKGSANTEMKAYGPGTDVNLSRKSCGNSLLSYAIVLPGKTRRRRKLPYVRCRIVVYAVAWSWWNHYDWELKSRDHEQEASFLRAPDTWNKGGRRNETVFNGNRPQEMHWMHVQIGRAHV